MSKDPCCSGGRHGPALTPSSTSPELSFQPQVWRLFLTIPKWRMCSGACLPYQEMPKTYEQHTQDAQNTDMFRTQTHQHKLTMGPHPSPPQLSQTWWVSLSNQPHTGKDHKAQQPGSLEAAGARP